jgi:hypothetical protein
VKSIKITNLFGDELTIKKGKKKKAKNPIVTTETGIGFQNKNYSGTMTFEELGIENPSPVPSPIPSPSPSPIPTNALIK